MSLETEQLVAALRRTGQDSTADALAREHQEALKAWTEVRSQDDRATQAESERDAAAQRAERAEAAIREALDFIETSDGLNGDGHDVHRVRGILSAALGAEKGDAS